MLVVQFWALTSVPMCVVVQSRVRRCLIRGLSPFVLSPSPSWAPNHHLMCPFAFSRGTCEWPFFKSAFPDEPGYLPFVIFPLWFLSCYHMHWQTFSLLSHTAFLISDCWWALGGVVGTSESEWLPVCARAYRSLGCCCWEVLWILDGALWGSGGHWGATPVKEVFRLLWSPGPCHPASQQRPKNSALPYPSNAGPKGTFPPLSKVSL